MFRASPSVPINWEGVQQMVKKDSEMIFSITAISPMSKRDHTGRTQQRTPTLRMGSWRREHEQ